MLDKWFPLTGRVSPAYRCDATLLEVINIIIIIIIIIIVIIIIIIIMNIIVIIIIIRSHFPPGPSQRVLPEAQAESAARQTRPRENMV